jgi:hypothetical protein
MRDYEIEWQSHEYEFSKKTPDWFWALGIVSVAIAITSIILNNLLFAILVIVGTIALGAYAVRKPDLVKYRITQRGVMVEEILYPYNSLDSFWIEHDVEKPKLLITSKKILMPHIVIPINKEVDTDELRDYLLDYVDEEEQKEPLAARIMEYLGF